MKVTVLIILVSNFSNCVFSQSGYGSGVSSVIQLNTITTAVPFLNISPDARAAGMGDAGVATSPDAYVLHWNTAKLAFSDKKSEIGFSYSPWLTGILNTINLYSLSGYVKLNNRHSIGGSISHFDLGKNSFIDPQDSLPKTYNPNEFEFLIGYAFQLNKRHGIGINGKFIYSNLTNGFTSSPSTQKAGQSVAVDISYAYLREHLKLGSKELALSFGANISNLGNKMTYSIEGNRDFIPANLKLGTALSMHLNKRNKITTTIDFNKLLVPTLSQKNGAGQILAGYNNNVGVLTGIAQSFYDAPGIIQMSPSGMIEIQKGSRLKEELNEITIGGGLEYSFADYLTLRGGFFYEHVSKGDRKFFTAGVGTSWRFIALDFSYLISMKHTNLFNNALRWSLLFKLQ